MKKVLFVINTLGGAGAEKALLELLKRFPENEYEVLLYVLLAQADLQTSFYERSYFQKSWIYAQKYGRNAEKRKALSGQAALEGDGGQHTGDRWTL